MHRYARLAIVIASLMSGSQQGDAQVRPSTKEVRFQDGLVVFAVPATWLEEYDDVEGTGTYYDDSPETGTLRLSVLSVRAPANLSTVSPADAIRAAGTQALELLPSGAALTKSVSRTSENGVPITLHHWRVAQTVGPNSVRIAIFSYTVASSREGSQSTDAEIAQVEQSVRGVIFGPAARD